MKKREESFAFAHHQMSDWTVFLAKGQGFPRPTLKRSKVTGLGRDCPLEPVPDWPNEPHPSQAEPFFASFCRTQPPPCFCFIAAIATTNAEINIESDLFV
jgi:hypothetical protein